LTTAAGANTYVVLTSGTSYTIAVAARTVKIWSVGGGGSGGAANANDGVSSGGGGAGGVAYKTWTFGTN
jgi:hypothetical protein